MYAEEMQIEGFKCSSIQVKISGTEEALLL